jgi:hypothetical protein
MSTETTEKKLYPSQINSKTISARIPVQDYVNFLNESINLGISLNDFLLRKIYNNNNNVGFVNKENVLNDELLNFINGYQFEVIKIEDKEDYWKETEKDIFNYNNPVHSDYLVRVLITGEGLGNYFYTLQQMIEYIQYTGKYIKQLKSDKTPNLMDIKVQIRSLVRSKIHRNDQDEYLKEINRLLRELE